MSINFYQQGYFFQNSLFYSSEILEKIFPAVNDFELPRLKNRLSELQKVESFDKISLVTG